MTRPLSIRTPADVMRSNGLTASAYTPVADLDPRVAEAFLVDLKSQGVAAYTKPVESSSTSGFDRPEFRVDVRDRLYVDAVAADEVRELISAQEPGLISTNDDLTWAQIVAGFDRPLADDVHPWPANEDIDWSPTTADGAPEADPSPPEGAPHDRPGDLRRWLSRRDARPAYEVLPDDETDDEHGYDVTRRPDDERFIPDPPPPLPALEPYKQLAWVGLIGGPVLMLVSVLFSLTLPTWVSLAAVAAFMGGFVTLVATMEDRIDPDGPSDDGAVV
ncbi:MAG: hypothetical protein ABJA81_07695 [Nocardioidaceae bacterium]